MATDPTGWFLTSQALDHHGTAAALDRAVQGQLGQALADDLAAGLARSGYALVQLSESTQRVCDLSSQVETFLTRKED